MKNLRSSLMTNMEAAGHHEFVGFADGLKEAPNRQQAAARKRPPGRCQSGDEKSVSSGASDDGWMMMDAGEHASCD